MRELSNIRNDIINLDEQSLLKKYLLNTDVWYFSEYHNFKNGEFLNNIDTVYEIISRNLSVSMKNILIIGSGKTGCSFAPHKALQVFDSVEDKESDIDIAIISEKYYREFWEIARKSTSVKFTRHYSEIASGVYNGFISKNAIDTIPEIRKVWRERIGITKRELQENTCIQHPVNFRIYRSWEDLEFYHLQGFAKLKKKFRGEYQ